MNEKRAARYNRLYEQFEQLIAKQDDMLSRMATINALLYHKMDGFFWVGFYLLNNGHLRVGPYQGPLACLELAHGKGVCWASVNQQKTIVVPDVNAFPDHIACDARSKSEIVVPVFDKAGKLIGVLDVDSNRADHFDETDAVYLEKIVSLLSTAQHK